MGLILFKKLFTDNPELIQYFPFKDEVDIYEGQRFKDHALRVIKQVGIAVGMLKDLDKLVPVLESLGERHVGYGVKKEHYEMVIAALLFTLEQGLKVDFTEEVRDSWVAVANIIKNTMIAGNYDDSSEEEDSDTDSDQEE